MGAPTIRETYDAIEKRLAPRLEAFVRTSHYAQLSAILVEARTAVAATVDGVAARVLHAVNLPAGTDVNRLHRQIGELDREVRQLRLDVAADPEQRGEVSRDVDAVRAPRRGRPDSR
jgi:phage host-nuclease inhibitor protein Gam